jgi:Flp pilus assembly protein TadD
MSEVEPESGAKVDLHGAVVGELATLFDEASGDIAIGELEAAVDKYRRCTELDHSFFDGWHALGMALMKTGRFPEAIEAGLRATQLRPNDQLAWSSLSMFYVRNHQIAEAEAAGVKARILSWGGKIAKDEPVAGEPTNP